MKILLASTPAIGHVNPLLAIGRMMAVEGHELAFLCGTAMRDRIESIGAKFWPLPASADFDLRNLATVFPERIAIPPGPEELRFNLEKVFIDPLPAQYGELMRVMDDFPADVIIADNLLLGVLPMLLGPRSRRPPIILCGTTFLLWHRDDGAPPCAGLPPATTAAEHERYAALAEEVDRIALQPAGLRLDRCLTALGVVPLTTNLFDALTALPDAYLQLTVPSFEFPRRDLPTSVSFVGALPMIPNQAPIPEWAADLDGSRKAVLVTQGTFANDDFRRLVEPTIAALADEPDLLLIVTCGGRPLDAIAGPLPGNVRMASYLPFEWLLPRIDAMVTNGGYGSVNQALSFGVPLVTAGLTEDKADVSARVAWRGVGIDLATDKPSPQQVRDAVRAVIDQPLYRRRARALAKEFATVDARAEIIEMVDELARRRGGPLPSLPPAARQRRVSDHSR
jgi:UDP:flavonoid glycosyltransferase YjiC (YdhE family)